MKKIIKIKNILIGLGIVLLLGIFIIYSIVNANKEKFYNFVIENVEKDINAGEKIKVNDIGYASRKLIINEIKLEVKNRKLYVNGKYKDIDDEDVVAVTGYYYQPSGTYNIYVLVDDDDEIYSLTDVLENEILEKEFTDTEIENVDKLVLVDITVEHETVGQLPERNRVYAKIDNKLIRIR